jgi:diadenosine tetraphosphate (Ap4A) HIT family hydrolase
MESYRKCTFCKIIKGESHDTILYKDDYMYLIKDIRPAGRVHLLAIPIEHITSINYLTQSNKDLIEHMAVVSKAYMEDKYPGETHVKYGFHIPPRISVKHLHMHVISPPFVLRKKFSFSSDKLFCPVDTLLNKLK